MCSQQFRGVMSKTVESSIGSRTDHGTGICCLPFLPLLLLWQKALSTLTSFSILVCPTLWIASCKRIRSDLLDRWNSCPTVALFQSTDTWALFSSGTTRLDIHGS